MLAWQGGRFAHENQVDCCPRTLLNRGCSSRFPSLNSPSHREAAATGDSAAEATELPMGTMQASMSWPRPCMEVFEHVNTRREEQVPAGDCANRTSTAEDSYSCIQPATDAAPPACPPAPPRSKSSRGRAPGTARRPGSGQSRCRLGTGKRRGRVGRSGLRCITGASTLIKRHAYGCLATCKPSCQPGTPMSIDSSSTEAAHLHPGVAGWRAARVPGTPAAPLLTGQPGLHCSAFRARGGVGQGSLGHNSAGVGAITCRCRCLARCHLAPRPLAVPTCAPALPPPTCGQQLLGGAAREGGPLLGGQHHLHLAAGRRAEWGGNAGAGRNPVNKQEGWERSTNLCSIQGMPRHSSGHAHPSTETAACPTQPNPCAPMQVSQHVGRRGQRRIAGLLLGRRCANPQRGQRRQQQAALLASLLSNAAQPARRGRCHSLRGGHPCLRGAAAVRLRGAAAAAAGGVLLGARGGARPARLGRAAILISRKLHSLLLLAATLPRLAALPCCLLGCSGQGGRRQAGGVGIQRVAQRRQHKQRRRVLQLGELERVQGP